jgi:hypothetical protein
MDPQEREVEGEGDMKKLSPAQILLEKHMAELGFDNVEVEYKFCKDRKWRADYFVSVAPSGCIVPTLIEIEGGVWSGHSRHTRGSGYSEDCLKYSTASVLGYRVFRFTTSQVLDGTARQFLKLWLT